MSAIKVGDLVTKKVCTVKGAKWYVQSINHEENYAYVGKSKVGGDTLREKATNLEKVL